MRQLLSPLLKLCELWKPKQKFSEAAWSLVDQAAFVDRTYRRRTTEIDLEPVHPDIKDFWQAFHKACKRRNIPVVPTEFYRSPQRQQQLFDDGFSRARKGQSPHQYGCAVDIVHARRLWDLSKQEWDVLGAIGKEVARKRNIKIRWGGDFPTFYDPAHWELQDWKKFAPND